MNATLRNYEVTFMMRYDIELTNLRRSKMLWTFFAVLAVMWMLGIVGGFASNLVHLLLLGAVMLVVINLAFTRRR